MTVKTFETYTIRCDEPGCRADFVEQWSGGEYSGMGSVDEVDLADIDWVERDSKHYCAEHAELHPEDADTPPAPETDPADLPPAMFDIEPQQEIIMNTPEIIMNSDGYVPPQTDDEQSEEDREALDQYDGTAEVSA